MRTTTYAGRGGRRRLSRFWPPLSAPPAIRAIANWAWRIGRNAARAVLGPARSRPLAGPSAGRPLLGDPHD